MGGKRAIELVRKTCGLSWGVLGWVGGSGRRGVDISFFFFFFLLFFLPSPPLPFTFFKNRC